MSGLLRSTLAHVPALSRDDYKVGLVFALAEELAAGKAMRDEPHAMMPGQDPQDTNSYALGRIHGHNVVLACLPDKVDGTISAATVAVNMSRTFTAMRFVLMVGIGGGIPTNSHDIRLGDIVVSGPEGTSGGIIQYDKGKIRPDGFERKGALNMPPITLLTALTNLKADHELGDSRVSQYLSDVMERYPKLKERGYGYPGADKDVLFCSCIDVKRKPCNICKHGRIARRCRKNHQQPEIHYGVIASGNMVIKDAGLRNNLSKEYGALCVEMEAAGLMNNFPCLVIRGICDYADSHKNDVWHRYAAATAAAFAKELLLYVSSDMANNEKPIREVMGILTDQLEATKRHADLTRKTLEEMRQRNIEEDILNDEEKFHDCRRSFKVSSYEADKNLNPDPEPGTCSWALNHPNFRTWRHSTHDDLLLISADPGCGKSVLVKFLVDNELRSTKEHTVCYFFFKDNDRRDTLSVALCSMLHQFFIAHFDLIGYALPAWLSNGERLQFEKNQLWQILVNAATDKAIGDITCVFDALDECGVADQAELIRDLRQFYEKARSGDSVQPVRQGRLKFLVTTRPYLKVTCHFQALLSRFPTVRLHGEEENDTLRREIDLVIRQQVSNLAKDADLDPGTRGKIEQQLLGMEQRTYLWLYLAFGEIRHTLEHSPRPAQESIKTLPVSVEDAYERILGRVGKEQRGFVRKILQIIVGTQRALTVKEMSIALGVAITERIESLHDIDIGTERVEKRIRDWCGLFVYINHSKIYLIHQTAKDFLMSNNDEVGDTFRWKGCLSAAGTQAFVGGICVDFLSVKNVDWQEAARPELYEFYSEDSGVWDGIAGFYKYSTHYWPIHFAAVQSPADRRLMKSRYELYETSNRGFWDWFNVYRRSLTPAPNFGPLTYPSQLELAALLGDEDVLRSLVLKDRDRSNLCATDGKKALAYACAYGHAGCTRILLDHGVDVNSTTPSGTALATAAEWGHDVVVTILLDYGANPDMPSVGQYGSALIVAVCKGHGTIVKILLDRGASINGLTTGDFPTALIAGIAVADGKESLVQLLLNEGANANAEVPYGFHGTALIAACSRKEATIVQQLLDHGADANAQVSCGKYGTALIAACSNSKATIVQQLLDHGAEPNSKVQHGDTGRVSIARTFRQNTAIPRYMPDPGFDSNTQPENIRDCGTALTAACFYGSFSTVQLLLEQGADVNAYARIGSYGTALIAACSRVIGDSKMVGFLLDRDADIDACAPSGVYGTALIAACFCDDSGTVQVLLDRGADVNTLASTGSYGTALIAACRSGISSLVYDLIARGADTNAQVHVGNYANALDAAAAASPITTRDELLNVLLERGTRYNVGLVTKYTDMVQYTRRHRHRVEQPLQHKGGYSLEAGIKLSRHGFARYSRSS
ncbi:hypothetical protein PV11_04825 [Exophiala sideris]|uniref:Uncharacterized protein n=1 Tax=Exophiala sideris TaxID=1016849 RepID=A0A0D1X4Z5_9EURO|nr:hypothetical protein PV11_04825 [Exophiala sideris]